MALRHLAFEDLGTISGVLTEEGFSVNTLDMGSIGPWGLDPGGADLLIVLGGPIGVYEIEEYPFLQQEIAFIKERLIQQRPTLGICLGAQLMAAALGAEVFPGGQKEIGFGALTLSDEGKQSCLAPLEEENAVVLHWHGDTFHLPDGAVRLAGNENYENQAFAIGDYGLGLQFHLEVSPVNFERWLIGHALEIAQTEGVSPQSLREAMTLHGPGLKDRSQRVFRKWMRNLPLTWDL